MTIVVNTKKDKGILLPLLLHYPLLKAFILRCYEEDNLEELCDYIMGLESESNY